MAREARVEDVQARALEELKKRVPGDARAQAWRLVRMYEWGEAHSLRLVRKAFDIELIGGRAYGYTRLGSQTIWINPMPLLSGVPGGEAAVRGLTVHELGHHVYNGSYEGRECWRKAVQRGLGSLMNLVADEHLERNPRALDSGYIDDRKTLCAYGFQKEGREMDALSLLRGDFRRWSNPGLLATAELLAALFRDELPLLPLLDVHEMVGGMEGEGVLVDAADVRQERASGSRQEARPTKRTSSAGQGLNTSGRTDFDAIRNVALLPYDAAAYRPLRRDVAAPAKRLRRVLERLGQVDVVERGAACKAFGRVVERLVLRS